MLLTHVASHFVIFIAVTLVRLGTCCFSTRIIKFLTRQPFAKSFFIFWNSKIPDYKSPTAYLLNTVVQGEEKKDVGKKRALHSFGKSLGHSVREQGVWGDLRDSYFPLDFSRLIDSVSSRGRNTACIWPGFKSSFNIVLISLLNASVITGRRWFAFGKGSRRGPCR